jgi:DnaJ-class molecular chaperone
MEADSTSGITEMIFNAPERKPCRSCEAYSGRCSKCEGDSYCPRCRGTGKALLSARVCITCSGTARCPSCSGTGRCGACGGTGWV